MMGIARAFALGPKPKRSLLFVWHTAEEGGLLGSRYMADYPVVPLDKIVAALNIDMVGRNRCDQRKEANTVYSSARIASAPSCTTSTKKRTPALPKPMKLDYELNDPADPESIYTRSDHYSYASKGIPIIFYTTGLHRDYHYVTDEVDKIEFPKMAHIAQLVYATGQRVANLDHVPARDNKGPRVGKGRGRENQVRRKKEEEERMNEARIILHSLLSLPSSSRLLPVFFLFSSYLLTASGPSGRGRHRPGAVCCGSSHKSRPGWRKCACALTAVTGRSVNVTFAVPSAATRTVPRALRSVLTITPPVTPVAPVWMCPRMMGVPAGKPVS